MLGQVVELRLGRVVGAATVEAARSHRGDGLVDVVGRPARVDVRVHEPGQPLALVRLQDLDPGRRQEPEECARDEPGDDRQHGEVPPRGPAEEERAQDDGRVDQRRAEVGLFEDQRHERRGEPDHAQRRPPLRQPVPALGDEPREHDDEDDLPELGRLEVEEADLDPAPRAAHLLGQDEHGEEQDDDGAVERPADTAVHVRVDGRGRGEEHDADDDVDRLPEGVVAGVARNVVLRHGLEHPEPVGEQAAGGREQQVVEVAQERAELPGEGLRAGGLVDAGDGGGHLESASSRFAGPRRCSCPARR